MDHPQIDIILCRVGQKRPPWGNVARTEIWRVRRKWEWGARRLSGREFQAESTVDAKTSCEGFCEGRGLADPDCRTQQARTGAPPFPGDWASEVAEFVHRSSGAFCSSCSVCLKRLAVLSLPHGKGLADHGVVALLVRFTHFTSVCSTLISLVWINFSGLGELLSVPWMLAMIFLAARTLHMLVLLFGTLHGQLVRLLPL